MRIRQILLSISILSWGSRAFSQKECVVLPEPPTLGTDSTFTATTGQFSPDEEIGSIQVKIETGSGIFSNDTDDVWLDLGPRAWKIGDSFPSNSTVTKLLGPNEINNSYFELTGQGKLRIRDLAYVRIEKKGICGLTDAPDSALDLLFPGGATPANLLPSARADVEKAQAALGIANDALTLHEKAIAAEQTAINDLDSKIDQLNNLKSAAEKTVIDLNTTLLQKQQQIESGAIQKFENVVQSYQEKTCSLWAIVIFGPAPCLSWKVETKTRVVQQVTQAFLDAQQFILNVQGQVASVGKQALDFQTQVTNAVSDKAAHNATLTQLLADKAAENGVSVASQALDAAKAYAAQLDDLAAKALAGLAVPQPGQWSLHAVTVAVNGKTLASFVADKRLKQHDSSVKSYLRGLTPEDEFLLALRANIPQEKSETRPNKDELLAGVTTSFFKDEGISGWQTRPLSAATVIGTLRHKPSPGSDNFVSFDLEVQEVRARGKVTSLAEAEVPRYIRIEYNNPLDTRYLQWPVGTRMQVEGDVLWDTDQYGFLELHPDRASQVGTSMPTDTLSGVPDVVTAVQKFGWWVERTLNPRAHEGVVQTSGTK